ncbi:VOC family protein [Aminipila luticellarii]|uniref:Lactoylglutathione lyase n=1 Tax=Aminipila luticellarii TaxID=2507160 RepID=A0A410PXA6_9FIRM|nr:VOC family protein [Aminipila luticellarii]QAT43597.1 lactoylglutathione lyase [Aminipila luticellarii]
MKFTAYHSCITVFDLDKSMRFYKEALGLKEIRRIDAEDGAYAIVFLGSDNSQGGQDAMLLELTWYRDRKEAYNLGDNESHIGFKVDDYEAAYKKHKEMGIICFENPDIGIYFISDPDGYWTEIVPTRE